MVARMATGLDLLPNRALDGGELRALAAAFASLRESWERHARFDPAQRTYHRLLRTQHASVWLLCWMPGHDTGFHDHDGAAGAVAVVQGRVREERLRLTGAPVVRELGAGELFAFGGADIHRVAHVGDEPAITIHAYSPTLRRMGSYAEAADGSLLRHALAEDDELRAQPVA